MYVHMNTKHTLLQTKNEACCSRDKISSINIVHFLGGRGWRVLCSHFRLQGNEISIIHILIAEC